MDDLDMLLQGFSIKDETLYIAFEHVPVDIVFEISKHLGKVDRMCLALTCKDLLGILDPEKRLQRNRLFVATNSHREMNWHPKRDMPYHPRWDLLQRLATNRWILCSACFKLHRPWRFYSKELDSSPDYERICSAGCYAGVARLCPCMEITFLKKSQIQMALLESRNFDERDRRKEFRIRGSVIYIKNGVGVHKCFSKYMDSSVKCILTIKLEDDQNFNVLAQYHIRQVNPSPVDLMKMALCPHRDVEHHLADIRRGIRVTRRNGRPTLTTRLRDPIASFFSEPALYCPWCNTRAWDVGFSSLVSSEIRTGFTVSRWFGSKCYGEADAAWYSKTTRSIEGLPTARYTTRIPEFLARS